MKTYTNASGRVIRLEYDAAIFARLDRSLRLALTAEAVDRARGCGAHIDLGSLPLTKLDDPTILEVYAFAIGQLSEAEFIE